LTLFHSKNTVQLRASICAFEDRSQKLGIM